MLLTTPTFFLFVFVTLVFYFLLPQKNRWVILLLASYFFCFSHNYQSVVVIGLMTFVNYFFGLRIESQTKKKKKTIWFVVAIILNVLLLIYFKYVAFSSENTLAYLSRATTQIGGIFIVAGISYYFLQSLSYLNDIRLQLIKPQRQIGKFALYLVFFPKLLAGPIETPENFFNQLFIYNKLDKDSFFYGIQRIVIGVFKKIVIADRLNIIVNNVFEVYDSASGLSLLVATYLFTIQLYFDLSSYADIAIGTARLFGFRLTENFNRPFLATSITDFWRKWHISLINWMYTYLFSPLTYYFRKSKQNAVVIAITITFIFSGLWHGLGFNFITWGFLYSFYMVFELISKKQRTRVIDFFPKIVTQPILIFITFSIVSVTNLLIRFPNLIDVKGVLNRLFTLTEFIPSDVCLDFIWQLSKKGELEFTFYTLSTLALTIGYILFENLRKSNKEEISYVRIFVLLILLFLFGIFSNSDQFLYIIY